MVCQICGKEVTNLGMSKHLKIHDLNVRTYYDLIGFIKNKTLRRAI